MSSKYDVDRLAVHNPLQSRVKVSLSFFSRLNIFIQSRTFFHTKSDVLTFRNLASYMWDGRKIAL